MERALLIGRFQPPHLGHLAMIKHILQENDELVIVIAAAQMSYSIKNPFTTGERLVMLRFMLEENEIDLTKIWLIPVVDVLDNDIWVTHLMRMIPPVNKIYGNNPFTKLLFNHAGYDIIPTPIYQREIFEARQIREKIAKGIISNLNLSNLVVDYLREINAVERLQSLQGTDSQTYNDASSNIKLNE